MGKDKMQQTSIFGKVKHPEGNVEVVDWGAVDAELIKQLVNIVTSRGGAVRFGYTRDGGAFAVGLYYGSDATTEYVRRSENIDLRIGDFIRIYEDLPNSGGKSPDQKR